MKAKLRFLRHTKAEGLFHYLHIHTTRTVKVNSLGKCTWWKYGSTQVNDDTGYADYMDKHIIIKVNHLKRFLTT